MAQPRVLGGERGERAPVDARVTGPTALRVEVVDRHLLQCVEALQAHHDRLDVDAHPASHDVQQVQRVEEPAPGGLERLGVGAVAEDHVPRRGAEDLADAAQQAAVPRTHRGGVGRVHDLRR